MTDQHEVSWTEALGQIRQVHPIAFILAFASMYLANHFLRSASPLEEKIVPVIILFLISIATIFFEVFRINKQAEEKERIWRRRVIGQ